MIVSLISCKRKGHCVSLVFMLMLVLIPFVLLNGCATVGTKSEDTKKVVPPVSNEVPKEARRNEFILGPGDKIQIEVYRHDDLKKTIQIDPSGKIAYPFIGDIEAGGLSIPQLRDKIQAGLAKYIIDPQVSINISSDNATSSASVRSQSVIVLGEVKNPGLFSLEVSYAALDVIALAGGFTSNAKGQNVLLIRGGMKKPEMITLDLKKVLNGQDMTQNVYLQKGDVLYVPVTGMETTARFFDHLQRILATFYQGILAGFMTTTVTTSTSSTSK